MKKLLLSLLTVAGISATGVMNAQNVLFQDSFETYSDFEITNVGGWTLTDVDGLTTYGFTGITFPGAYAAKSFQVFNSTATTPPMTSTATSNWTAHTGSKMMAAFASTEAPWNNDWLISPQVQLLADGGTLSFWAKSCDATYGLEKFKVYVSTTGTAVADFTAISAVITTPSDAAWHEYSYDLSAYAGQAVHIAIQCTSQDQFGFAIDDFKVVSNVPQTEIPGCSVLVAPANNATNVAGPVTLSWNAPTTGGTAASYDVYFGTTPNPTTLLGNYSTTSTSVPSSQLAPLTTYYWRVIPKNNVGPATGCTTEFSFTTKSDPFLPYCGPLPFTSTVEPITLVNFAGINNTTAAATAGATAHEVFTNMVGNVAKGSTYTITLQGNTNGNYTNRFAVFVDWNQNGVLNDPGEVYEVTQTLVNSNGTDGKQVTHDIIVPTGALEGNTRMRVKKIFGTTNTLNPCLGASFGQAEDYTIAVGPSLAVADASKTQAKVYPNPIVDVVNVDAASKVNSIAVYDQAGKLVSTHTLNAVKNQINLGKLTPGVYLMKISTENGTQTVKVIKK